MESKVAIAINVPAFARVLAEEPLSDTTKELTRVPERRKINPSDANFRAAVVEKYVTKRTIAIGLMHHHGNDPGPPGFARNAKFGPPPGIVNPISARSRLGFTKMANEAGAESKSGSPTSVPLRITRWINSGLL
jgi:hypothetical protein